MAFEFAHSLFCRPTAEQFDWLHGPECASLWQALSATLGGLPESLPLPPAPDEFESQYIVTFDVGGPTPVVPLLESHYNHRDPLPRVLHENILFHRHFGLRLHSAANESADHLRHQLEFLAALTGMRRTCQSAEDAGQIERGLADFAKRHLLSWLPQAIASAGDAPLKLAQPALQLSLSLVTTLIYTVTVE